MPEMQFFEFTPRSPHKNMFLEKPVLNLKKGSITEYIDRYGNLIIWAKLPFIPRLLRNSAAINRRKCIVCMTSTRFNNEI
jgi:hypothetical protein